MPTIVGLYETLQEAQGAVSDLVEAGFARGAVSLVLQSELSFDVRPGGPGADPFEQARVASVAIATSANAAVDCPGRGPRNVLVAGPLANCLPRAAGDGNPGSVLRALASTEIGATAAHYFTDAVCAGAILVAVRCEDIRVRDARDILDGHAPADPHWMRIDRPPRPAAATAASRS